MEEVQNLRVQKLNEILKEELGKILFRNIDISRDTLITIPRIKTSPDQKNSTIYITVFPDNKEEEVLTMISKQIYDIQKLLNRTLRTKPVPRIRFEIDKITKAEQQVYETLEKTDATE